MTKRITAALFALILIFSIAILPAYAESTYNYKLDDAANVLNPNEESQLLSTIKEVSEACKCNLAFVTVNDINGASFSHNGTTQDYADRYYENEYGKVMKPSTLRDHLNKAGYVNTNERIKDPNNPRQSYVIWYPESINETV